MRARIILLVILFAGVLNHYMLADAPSVETKPDTMVLVGDTLLSTPSVISHQDTLYMGDTILVIHTVCAPICSSRARIYNKEWQEIGILRPPFISIFPEAYIEDGKLYWRDNDTFDYSPAY